MDIAHDRCKIGEFLIASNGDRLNKELVTAFGVGRGLLLHSL